MITASPLSSARNVPRWVMFHVDDRPFFGACIGRRSRDYSWRARPRPAALPAFCLFKIRGCPRERVCLLAGLTMNLGVLPRGASIQNLTHVQQAPDHKTKIIDH